MTWNWKTSEKWQRYLAAILIIAIASVIRAVFFGGLGRGTAYLTYYPAVVLAALYGGLHSGFVATAISALLCFFWIQKGFMSFVESMAMGVFLISCIMISGISEAMRRAQVRARQEKEKAEAANLAKSIFLASMSHELRTPLNAILGFSRIMREDAGLSMDQRSTLDIINHSGEHLLNLINDVLDMAKVEAGCISVENTLFDLREMVLDIIDLLHARAEEKGLQLLLDQTSEFPRFVRSDCDKLRQAFINLVGNAIKFTQQGSVTLHLNARPTDIPERLLLIVEVKDTGVGISAEDQMRIFDPFIQVSGLALQKGTGLGLAITRKYVELLGGRISVESAPGKGSIFRMEMTVERAKESEVSKAGMKRQRVVGLEPGQPEYRILIVEDQMENWLLLRRLMENVGFSVRVAENGLEGVETFRTWQPHFIWMDIRMPVMDGLEATRRIRAQDSGREVKIAALTASVFKEEHDNVMAAGMDDFIRKPFRLEEVFDCLARQLDVRFVHKEAPTTGTETLTVPLRPEALTAMPQALREELAKALISLNTASITEIIHRVFELDPAMGKVLEQHADQFNYTVILRSIQAIKDNTVKETT